MNRDDLLLQVTNRTKGLRALVYGPSGSGKTYFGLTMPRVFVFDFDGGLLTALHPALPADFEYESYADLSDGGITAFEKTWNAVMARDDIESVFVDSLTTMADHAMRRILKLDGKAGKIPQIQHYNALMNQLRAFFYAIPPDAKKKHVVVSAHEQFMENKSDDTSRTAPLIVGKLVGQIGMWFDEMYHAEMSGMKASPKFTLRTIGSSGLDAKSRLRAIAPIDVNEPNDFRLIWKKVVSATERKEDKVEK